MRVQVHPFHAVSGDVGSWLDQLSGLISRDITIVITDARSVHGPSHLRSAILHAHRSIRNGSNRAKDPSIEVLRWITCSRQVSEALFISSIQVPGGTAILMLIEGLDGTISGPDDISPVIEEWKGIVIEGLEPIKIGKGEIWGGSSVRERLDIGDEVEDGELELAVLELVAMTEG